MQYSFIDVIKLKSLLEIRLKYEAMKIMGRKTIILPIIRSYCKQEPGAGFCSHKVYSGPPPLHLIAISLLWLVLADFNCMFTSILQLQIKQFISIKVVTL